MNLMAKLHDVQLLTLVFVFVEQPAQIHESLVCNVFIVYAHPLPLAAQEVGGIYGTSTAAVYCIKALPVHEQCVQTPYQAPTTAKTCQIRALLKVGQRELTVQTTSGVACIVPQLRATSEHLQSSAP